MKNLKIEKLSCFFSDGRHPVLLQTMGFEELRGGSESGQRQQIGVGEGGGNKKSEGERGQSQKRVRQKNESKVERRLRSFISRS